jgi:hypothetical protein
MTFRVTAGISVGLLLVAVASRGTGVWAQHARVPPPIRATMPEARQNALVEEYCSSCHSSSVKAGELVLTRFNVTSPLLSAELLEKMIRKLRSGQMPPANQERPEPGEMAAFVDALEARADAMATRSSDPGWRPFQRLNRAEYARVIKDLLAVDIDPSAILPPDTASAGFDNIADVQTVSPTLITAYLRGAATVSRAAVGETRTDTPSRRKIFACTPRTPGAERSCAERILRRLSAMAYRGAATDLDINDLLLFYERGRQHGSFDDGIRLALESMLVSPKFLFRVESVEPSGELSDLSLASRLSFFLWSTGPDDVLVAAARRGALHSPAQLSAQARRMLLDPRADAMSTRFAAQWLRLQDLEKNVIDPKLFPSFDPSLAKAMRRETELTVDDVIRRDGSVMELITSNRSFINERLATHYGIKNVRGSQFRAVTMPESRRGLLGEGSILTLTSLGTRTSPVLRGKWVLDVLLGTPPPPPPPNVPALEDSTKAEKDGAPLTTRQRVEEHRRNPSCSGCHRVIDPPGMALENFDATGAWRTRDNGVAIDATAELYDGLRMDGAAGLRAAIVAHDDMFFRNFTQQLMTYALGRRLGYRDMPAVRAIVRAAAGNNNRVSAFITGVVTSDAFRMARPVNSR